ncbi:hypothetical protein ACFLSJ_05485 [Verrucomicrobiota bacterium]
MTAELLIGYATMGVIFLLLIILGLEIRINTLARRIDRRLQELMKE